MESAKLWHQQVNSILMEPLKNQIKYKYFEHTYCSAYYWFETPVLTKYSLGMGIANNIHERGVIFQLMPIK